MVYLISDDIFILINYMSFVQWWSVGMSILALIYLRITRPEMPRPISVSILILEVFKELRTAMSMSVYCRVLAVKFFLKEKRMKSTVKYTFID